MYWCHMNIRIYEISGTVTVWYRRTLYAYDQALVGDPETQLLCVQGSCVVVQDRFFVFA